MEKAVEKNIRDLSEELVVSINAISNLISLVICKENLLDNYNKTAMEINEFICNAKNAYKIIGAVDLILGNANDVSQAILDKAYDIGA